MTVTDHPTALDLAFTNTDGAGDSTLRLLGAGSEGDRARLPAPFRLHLRPGSRRSAPAALRRVRGSGISGGRNRAGHAGPGREVSSRQRPAVPHLRGQVARFVPGIWADPRRYGRPAPARSWPVGVRSMLHGHRPGRPDGGDISQNPGTFLIDRTGHILRAQIGRHAGDFPSAGDVWAGSIRNIKQTSGRSGRIGGTSSRDCRSDDAVALRQPDRNGLINDSATAVPGTRTKPIPRSLPPPRGPGHCLHRDVIRGLARPAGRSPSPTSRPHVEPSTVFGIPGVIFRG